MSMIVFARNTSAVEAIIWPGAGPHASGGEALMLDEQTAADRA
jgi:hypothetical protein